MKREYHEATLDELRDRIKVAKTGRAGEVRVNQIAQALRMISGKHGVDEANRAIRDFGLLSEGWEEQVGEEPETPGVDPRDLIDPLDRIEREDPSV